MEHRIESVAHEGEAEDTRERILLSARKLFADRGFDATSVRDITAEARCNVASVNYHFGGKDKLYLESFRSMLGVLRDRRIEMMGEMMARDPLPTLEEYVATLAKVFLDPLVESSDGRLFLDFVSREMIAPSLPKGVFLHEFIDPLMERAVAALAEIGPPMDGATARLCTMSLVGQLLHAIKAHHLFVEHGRSDVMPVRFSDYITHFVRFSVGGIEACADREAQPREKEL
jgi:AcrR family transcriptional regulator